MEENTLDPNIRERVIHTFEKKIPFNVALGFRVTDLTLERAVISWDLQPQQIGNFVQGILHGGVTSSALDVAGGLLATARTFQRLKARTPEELAAALAKIGTIDLRVDYLRPGRGQTFRASAYFMRAGSRVAVTRMELHNEDDRLLATGTGTYIVG